MKKHLLLLIAMITGIALLIASCSGKKPTDTENPTEKAGIDPDELVVESFSPEEEKIEQVMTGKTDLDSMSLDELLAYADAVQDDEAAVLNQGAEYDLLYRDQNVVSFDEKTEIGFNYSDSAHVVIYSDEPWKDGDFEALDVTENMSPADKAAFEAAMQELENFDAEAFQSEIDDMLIGMDEFEDYEPETSDDAPSLLNEWPDNEFTRQAPVPSFAGGIITSSEENVTMVTYNVSESDAMAYVSAAKAKGFTVDPSESDQNLAGYRIYSYTAENAAGYVLNFSFVSGTTTIVITK